nr:hypothetical protein [Tanacetum cinerariifolium]
MNNKKHVVDLESFREMLHICPRIPGQAFAELPFEEEILEFIRFIGHAISSSNLVGLYHTRSIDYAFLIWEDFVYQVEYKNKKKSNEMYYPRFIKVIIHHFMPKDPSIPGRNKINWHYVRGDSIFSTIKVVSRHQNTQQYGAMQPIELTNDVIRNTKAYKEDYAFATGEAAPKPKASARRKRSGSDTSITPLTATTTPTTTVAISLKLTTAAKGKQLAKAKSLSDPSKEVAKNDDKDDTEESGNVDEEGESDEDDDDEETRDEESFDPIHQTSESSKDEGDGEEDQGLRISEEKRLNEEEKAKELYRDININQGRGIQATLDVEDSHVTLTPIHPDGQQESSSVSSQFVTSMLNPPSDADEQRNLYKALVDAYKADKTILDSYGETVILKKRRDDDDDQDEGPSAGSDQGSKRHRECKEPESASAPLDTTTRSAGRSTTGSKSRQVSASESAFVEEPVQTISQIDEPSCLMFETGADDQTIVQSSQHPEWFSQPKKPLTPDRDWNKTLPAVKGSTQTWISKLAKQADSRSSFNELRDTPLDFSNFIMNQLRVDTLTPELLDGPTFELMKGSICRNDDKLYKFKEGDFKRLHLQDIEDMLLLLVQGKLSNLTVEERFAFNVSLRMLTRSIIIQRRMEDLQLGVESYQKMLNLTKPDTYRFDLNDRTLNDVLNALDDHLKGIRMQYLPQTIWRKGDKDRAAAMIQAIYKMLKTRRIMRSLERFVGGRLYERDFWMLQRTI